MTTEQLQALKDLHDSISDLQRMHFDALKILDNACAAMDLLAENGHHCADYPLKQAIGYIAKSAEALIIFANRHNPKENA